MRADADSLLDKYRGCLLGLAAGDALGVPVEFMSSVEISRRYGLVTDYMPFPGYRLGEGGDDTYQMLAIAESYAELGEFDREDIARRFVHWYGSDGRGIGRTTYAVLSRLASGHPLDGTAQAVARELGDMAAGNGSLMRCAPTALIRARNAAARDAESRSIAAITHADRRCLDACVVMNRAIALLLEDPGQEDSPSGGGEADAPGAEPAPFLPRLLAEIGDIEPRTRAAVLALTSLTPAKVRTGGYVLETLQAALWTLVHSPSFEDGIISILSFGDDADTTAAVAGALLGAKYGMSGIPQRWLDGLYLRDRVIAAADGLYEIATRNDIETAG